jgi:hypothetical protein
MVGAVNVLTQLNQKAKFTELLKIYSCIQHVMRGFTAHPMQVHFLASSIVVV